jgi:hypothetical protein
MQIMSTDRITIEVTARQKQQIKGMAALQGQTIKQFVIDRLFTEETDEQTMKRYKQEFLAVRNKVATNAKKRGLTPEILEEILAEDEE